MRTPSGVLPKGYLIEMQNPPVEVTDKGKVNCVGRLNWYLQVLRGSFPHTTKQIICRERTWISRMHKDGEKSRLRSHPGSEIILLAKI